MRKKLCGDTYYSIRLELIFVGISLGRTKTILQFNNKKLILINYFDVVVIVCFFLIGFDTTPYQMCIETRCIQTVPKLEHNWALLLLLLLLLLGKMFEKKNARKIYDEILKSFVDRPYLGLFGMFPFVDDWCKSVQLIAVKFQKADFYVICYVMTFCLAFKSFNTPSYHSTVFFEHQWIKENQIGLINYFKHIQMHFEAHSSLCMHLYLEFLSSFSKKIEIILQQLLIF